MGYTYLLVDVAGMRVLVVGGGEVGARRALMLAGLGAKVKVLSLEFDGKLVDAAERGVVELVEGDALDRDVLEELLGWAQMVVVALPRGETAERVASEARRRGLLVNVASDHSLGNVIVPFQSSVAGLRVAVSSMGESGLAARRALEKIVDMLESDEEVRCLAETHGFVKKLMWDAVGDYRVRMAVHSRLWSDGEYREYCRRGDVVAAYRRALEVLRAGLQSSTINS